jgi:hypothetical protein
MRQNPEIENAIDFQKVIVSCDFVPAKSYVIITDSSSDIVSSRSTQRISYIPANIRDDHFASLMNLNSAIVRGIYSDQTLTMSS